ncbi:Translation initiation factor IF-3 [Buchnera aphidicola (Cinara pseudotaxifoliae)]|uniref:Translation initiation factor IF-3 n=1 Tax=Buchnera aphidicola (Cinara pseudotaxifoliae) TaxID=655384 RepID=A0A451DGF2_9GAMM|nr:translation initiation factor IF-3 [Buchnera aphidicola]VFP85694.1 Translation initiation factor IF-3 [Buchnera aphidicola (Cinara pseudotaxifoliae)]
MKVGKKNQLSRPHRVNYEIRSAEVRLTGLKGESLGIVSIHQALEKAKIQGFDLVEISPNSKPPVCRIMNYGKFLYEKNKALKKQKKKQRIVQIKEIKFRPNTDEGDYQVKLRNLIRFLKDGNKIKITLRFRGREMTHKDIGINMLNRLKNDLSTLTYVESFPTRIEGRQMIMILSPKR